MQDVGVEYITQVNKGIQKTVIDFGNVINDAITESHSYDSKFTDTGAGYVNKISEGIAKTAITFSKTISNAVAAARKYYNNFYSAGQYCAQGFANGMYNDQYRVTRAGTSLGNAAYNAAARAIRSHSPSRRFYQLGEYSIAGYVNAMKAGLGSVSKSGAQIGLEALEALKDAMDAAKTALETEETQPVIRPVVDMTDIQHKSASISKYFSTDGAYIKTGMNVSANFDANKGIAEIKIAGSIDKKALDESIAGLRSDVAGLREVVGNLKVFIDKGTLIGSMAADMDTALNKILGKKARHV